VEFAAESRLWSTRDGEPYATVWVDDHVEHWAIQSNAFRFHLAQLYYKAEHAAPSSNALESALSTIAGQALYGGNERHPAPVRVAGVAEGYLDLVNARWQVVEVSVTGWTLIESKDCPIRFRRDKAMQPLPAPERGAELR